MATITEVQLQDGTVHQLGGGGSNTYTLTKSGDTITLTGSGGDVSSVTDEDTTYTLSISGNTLTLTPSSGSAQSVTLPDDDTTYSLSISDNTITLIASDGTTSTVTVPDNDTTYTLNRNLETITHMLYVNLDGGGYEYYEDNFVVNNNGVEYLVGDHQVYIVDSDGNDITGISTYNLRWTGTATDAYTFGQNLYDYFATHNAYRLKIDGVLTQKITKYGTYYDLTEALPNYDHVTAKEWVHQGTGGDVFGVTAQGVVLGNKSTIDLVGSDGTTSSVNLKAIDIGALPTAQYHVNDATHDGYVKSPSGLPGIRVWKTDATGEPGWRLENSGTTYTATSPIDITNDDISHEDSGVTAGTYDGGSSKRGFYVPSFTVDAKGHITNASEVTTFIPRATFSSPYVDGLLYPYSFLGMIKSGVGNSSYDVRILSGNTSASISISKPSDAYIQIIDVVAIDATTFEKVVVDYSVSPQYSMQSPYTVTVSIAESYEHNIVCNVLCKIFISNK